MSNPINDGGPAFPLAASTGDPRDGVYCCSGMTLRDYFAAAALTGQLMCIGNQADPEKRSKEAYRYADAMLAERAKR